MARGADHARLVRTLYRAFMRDVGAVMSKQPELPYIQFQVRRMWQDTARLILAFIKV
jgi:hypothetical protein